MAMKRIKEGSSAEVTVQLRDVDGVLAIPMTLEYRIDCVESKAEIRDWTEVPTPTAEETIELTPEDSAMMLPERDIEKHEITFRAVYPGGGQVTNKLVYEVANLRFLAG